MLNTWTYWKLPLKSLSVVSITGGNPQPILERIKDENIHSLVLVSTVRQAQKAEKLGLLLLLR